ncbi:D-isomer specific 2-hydroxyacid dehydrogenase [Catenovulum agarivorans DS-2]|uniref:Erythronate-4-phosphate dehydrogenase n=1 Tax=Catenovulum agarivorans DS-2 TaxID=1328313 RepID=W7QQ18_9ALTE|nr:4-phosphoerythronate dehydrogenase [Catenovulum agarivorans]EWH10003.1 D-isomer specific 2-hydroxyacid dehydrogenase [Catenovulum agarivorans DS-2]
MTAQPHFFIEDSLLYAEAFFSSLGKISRFSGRTVTADDIADADYLLTRSTTKVNEKLLHKCHKLKFVGTATAGYNHIDADYLAQRNVEWAPAAGCNADAVADYVISSGFNLANKYGFDLNSKKVAIVGVGQIGKRLVKRFSALGCEVIQFDPVRAQLESAFESATFEQVLKCDFITCHVPYVHSGEHKTHHMFDKQRLLQLKPETILINACRGEVINNAELVEVFQSGHELRVVLDVFENEPNINMALLPFLEFGTPHIAGHSLEGKARGTEILYQIMCERLELPVEIKLQDLLPAMAVDHMVLTEKYQLSQRQFRALMNLVYDIRNDDLDFRMGLAKSPESFDRLRRNYSIRRELTSLKIQCDETLYPTFTNLGFNTSLING